MELWKRIEPTTIHKVGWRTITTKTFERPDGQTTTFDVLHADGQEFVNVLALTDDNKVVIARQFRPGPEILCDELPGGYVDKGETPKEAALRELKEETGYVAGNINYLGAYYKDTYINATWHAFFATKLKQGNVTHVEDDEYIEVDAISISQLFENVKIGKMTDQQTILMAYDLLKEIE